MNMDHGFIEHLLYARARAGPIEEVVSSISPARPKRYRCHQPWGQKGRVRHSSQGPSHSQSPDAASVLSLCTCYFLRQERGGEVTGK